MAASIATRYADFGKGEHTICLIHGYLESMEVWEHFAGQLGKSYRVITLDLPGHGLADWGNREIISVDFMAEVVNAVLEKANVDTCTVVGHSMGGYVAVALAELYPERVSGLVLFHSSANADTPEKREFRLREIAAIEAGKKELLSTINPGRGFATENRAKFQETIDELAEQIMMTEDAAIVATLRGLMERPDRSTFFASSPKPRLMIFGRDDSYIPVSTAEALTAANPTAQVAWLDHSGHMGFVEQPIRSKEILDHFIHSETTATNV